jgi:hypothetical protein
MDWHLYVFSALCGGLFLAGYWLGFLIGRVDARVDVMLDRLRQLH